MGMLFWASRFQHVLCFPKNGRQTNFPQMGAAKLTAKFMELMESSPEDQLGDNLKKVMKDR